ncbi:MAG: YihA family ribosome biogenesis GTP-binding protein, partial [Pseudomonadota bacterium]
KDKVAAWQALLRAYLAGRVSLRRVFVLIDSRHGVKSADHEIMALLDTAAVSFQAVLTKADKKGAALTRTVEAVKTDLARHPTAYPEILTTSAETGQGLDRLRAAIAKISGMD